VTPIGLTLPIETLKADHTCHLPPLVAFWGVVDGRVVNVDSFAGVEGG
jgi:hypothetical protein